VLKHPIETIIFDLDGTLRHNVPSADDVQFNYLVKQGIDNSPGLQVKGARWVHYYWAQSKELFADLEKFGEMNADFWGNYCYRYLNAIDVPAKQVAVLAPLLSEHMQNNFDPEDYVHPCVPETLGNIKHAGYNLGLISNRSSPCQDLCKTLGILPYFDFVYVAAEVDVWKPDPRIFDRGLGLTGSRPERTVYIGDNYYADVVAAQNAGLQPVLLDPKSIFPDPGCAVISKIQDLNSLLSI
jgi:HAD superfamily hydrolase (TIGR01549 family)